MVRISVFLIIDGNSYLHKAFHALKPMHAPDGTPTNAVYGMLKMMEGIIPTVSPTHMAVCFDASKHGTFRHRAYPEYKANRKETHPQLVAQFPVIRKTLGALGIPYFEDVEYEADDLAGSLAEMAEGYTTYIATGDKDCIQLISPRTKVLFSRKGHNVLSLENAEGVLGVPPHQVVDFKALAGDTSDNIPGAKNVGEKTAVKLIKEYGSALGVIENAHRIPGKIGEAIRDSEETIRMSHFLATIKRDCPMDADIDSLKLNINKKRGMEKLFSLGIV